VSGSPTGVSSSRASVAREEVHEAVGLRVRERAQERRAHDAEDGDVRADTERDGEHDRGGEAGTAGEGAERVARVLEKAGHGDRVKGGVGCPRWTPPDRFTVCIPDGRDCHELRYRTARLLGKSKSKSL